MEITTKPLYDTDFALWADHTAELIRAGRLDEVDLENVAEEIASLGRSERRAVRSQLKRMLLHRIKQQIQSDRGGASWETSVNDARQEILDALEDSPSLRPHLEGNLEKIYRMAVELALIETGVESADLPERCPFTLDQLLQPKEPW